LLFSERIIRTSLPASYFNEVLMPAQAHEELARKARFVFHGTVQGAAARAVPGLPGVKALTVRVDEIVQGPEKLGAYEGRDVLLIPQKGERLSRDARAVFYTNGVAFGETLTVESIGHVPLPAGAVGVRSTAHPAAALRKREVEHRVASADAVVVGKVATVRLPASDLPRRAARGAAAAMASAPRGPISEHDPQWREAVIQVERVAKGRSAAREVVVRFPASDDVRWFRAPKFAPGDQGVFILHRSGSETTGPQPPAAARASLRALGAAGREVFTALHPEDVQPPEFQEEIGTIVKSAPATSKAVAKRRAGASRGRKTSRKKSASRRRSSR
jgi:hypothetical protein